MLATAALCKEVPADGAESCSYSYLSENESCSYSYYSGSKSETARLRKAARKEKNLESRETADSVTRQRHETKMDSDRRSSRQAVGEVKSRESRVTTDSVKRTRQETNAHGSGHRNAREKTKHKSQKRSTDAEGSKRQHSRPAVGEVKGPESRVTTDSVTRERKETMRKSQKRSTKAEGSERRSAREEANPKSQKRSTDAESTERQRSRQAVVEVRSEDSVKCLESDGRRLLIANLDVVDNISWENLAETQQEQHAGVVFITGASNAFC